MRDRSTESFEVARRAFLVGVAAILAGRAGRGNAQPLPAIQVVARVTASVQALAGGHSSAYRLVPVVVVAPEAYVGRRLTLRMWLPAGAGVGDCIPFSTTTALLDRALAGRGRLLVRSRTRTSAGPCG